MSSATLLPNAEQQFIDEDGKPYSGGFVYFYVPGTTTPKDTFQDENGTILNTNPVILDAAGRAIILGTGDYRQVLFDSAMNMIWDQITSAPLPDDAISAVMAPVVAAATLQQARDLMGVTAAINTAIKNVSLLPGPAGPSGPTGPAGPTGATGPTGPAGAGGGGSSGGGFIQAGTALSDSNGFITVTYSVPFPTSPVWVMPCTISVPGPTPCFLTSFQALVFSSNTAGFQAQIVDINNNNSPLANTQFNWFSIGF